MGLVSACATLVAALAVVGIGFGFYGDYRYGAMGLWSAVVAGVVCALAGCLALSMNFAGSRLGLPLHGVLASTLIRLGMPLLIGLALQELSAPLAAAGVFAMILGNYLCMLLVETGLSLKFVSQPSKPMTRAA